MIRVCFTFIVVAFSAQVAACQEDEPVWKQLVIPTEERSFDFKTLAKGTVAEHRFVIRNPLQEPLRIKNITSSCTCTTIDFDVEDEEQSVLKTYEETCIPIRFRGDMFEGQRNSTITVVFDQSEYGDIQLHVRGTIRSDLKISTNVVDFGNVEMGAKPSRPLTVTYRGANTQWRIVDIQCENEFIRTEMTSDLSRIGEKTFRILVSLDESVPNGSINAHLILMSNESGTRREIPILVRATVGTVIGVRPPALSLGVLLSGEVSPQKEVILRGTKPFRITKIECDNPAIDIPLEINPDAPEKKLYAIPVIYRNPKEGDGSPREGVMRSIVRVTTDIPDLEATFYITASVRE
jgi:hypothetical protein